MSSSSSKVSSRPKVVEDDDDDEDEHEVCQATFLQALGKTFAAQPVWGWVDAAGAWCGEGSPSEGVAQRLDGVGRVDLTVVVGVGGLSAGWRVAPEEEITQDGDRVGCVYYSIGIGVAAAEVLWLAAIDLAFLKGKDLGAR